MSVDKINLYPTNSCLQQDCKGKYSIPLQGPKSNLAIRGCEVSPYFDCYDRVELRKQILPAKPINRNDLINPEVYNNKVAAGFDQVGCQVAPTCPTQTYISMDPRLYDAARAVYLPLDRPPIDGDVKLRDVYSPKLDGYGIGFTPYEQIRDGQITYYIDQAMPNALNYPVFSEPAEVSSVLYRDPMGAMKPEYNRKALINTHNPTVTTAKNYPYCLSYIQDSQSFREDLMALQQRKNNQMMWMPRWAEMNE